MPDFATLKLVLETRVLPFAKLLGYQTTSYWARVKAFDQVPFPHDADNAFERFINTHMLSVHAGGPSDPRRFILQDLVEVAVHELEDVLLHGLSTLETMRLREFQNPVSEVDKILEELKHLRR